MVKKMPTQQQKIDSNTLDNSFWGRYFGVYDVLNMVMPYQELLKEICKEAGAKEGEFVLDAGVGTGNLALLLEEQGAEVVGLDFSPIALEIYRDKNPDAKTILADLIERLPFDDGSFDKIVSNNALYNIPREKRPEALKEIKRVLKSGGKIVLSNIHREYRPLKIYMAAAGQNIRKHGLANTIRLLTKMFIPTLRIFYYNHQIKKAYKTASDNLFDYDEQHDLLVKAGFDNVSKTRKVYAGQGVLNSAVKP